MQPLENSDPDFARANRLYWESGRSVNQIADEMDLSKGMLYEMIQPLGSGVPCPRCSAETRYSNRTARERGMITCPSCGLEADEAEVAVTPRAVGSRDEAPTARPRPVRSGAARGPDPFRIGAGLLLIATGIWLFRGLRKR
jgi:transposase-like protein